MHECYLDKSSFVMNVFGDHNPFSGGLTCNAMQALLITAAGLDGRAKEHLSQRNAKEQQALEIALQAKQWYAVQLLVTAGMTCFHEATPK